MALSKVANISNLLNNVDILDELQLLLDELESLKFRQNGILKLHQLAKELTRNSECNSHLKLQQIASSEKQCSLQFILHPAVFSPEEWGQTFAEGLLKQADSFAGKTVIELGTGSGWISLLLLTSTHVKQILGLDINPIAILIARLNAWLNGTTVDGVLKMTPYGVPLIEAFSAHVSDLLSLPISENKKFDRVIGCIPQVLHPDPDALEHLQSKPSHRQLYDLSNYCFEQGILEDRFGLPLIARALEQTQLCLNPQGKVTFILGGRPGQAAIESMFNRRGYNAQLYWSRRIKQADDTDLVSLVKLEKKYGIKFHFFASSNSKHSIPASTAVKLLAQGQPIHHDLLVYNAVTNFEKPTFSFVQNLHKMHLDELRQELDFSRISEEQISFLSKITTELIEHKTLPYPHERSDIGFRTKFSQFLKLFCHYLQDPEKLFVGPERAQLLSMILNMIPKSKGEVLLSSSLENVYGKIIEQNGRKIIYGNDDLSELMELDKSFIPEICIWSPYQLNDPSLLLLNTLIEHAKKNLQCLYIIDDSLNFDIASNLKSNLTLQLIGSSHDQLPENLVFLYGLIKNIVCPDLELSFLVNSPPNWLVNGLDVAAELTYSRIAYPTQLYYEWLFEELLSFPITNKVIEPLPIKSTSRYKLDNKFESLLSDPVFAPKPISTNDPDLIRLDYGEQEAPVPDLLVKGLIKGFLQSPEINLVDTVVNRIANYFNRTRKCNIGKERIVLGQGVFPLLGALISALKEKLERPPAIGVHTGNYGPIYPMLNYHGATIINIPTQEQNGFLLTARDIEAVKDEIDLLWITQPANPSGIFYEPEAIKAITELCIENEIYVLSDEIFFLLSDLNMGTWTPAAYSFASHADGPFGKYLFVVDGVAKAFAAGGLRAGFMLCPDNNLAQAISSHAFLPPKSTLATLDNLYCAFLVESPHNMIDVKKEYKELENYLHDARLQLDNQRKALVTLLDEYGLSDNLKNVNRGGLFLLAQLSDNVENIANTSKLLINSSEWARTNNWTRICFSLESKKFKIALNRLEKYLRRSIKISF
jgi:aspartate/methionine/tyrosine aminotransferase/methylase of polypeptide subunit release factors